MKNRGSSMLQKGQEYKFNDLWGNDYFTWIEMPSEIIAVNKPQLGDIWRKCGSDTVMQFGSSERILVSGNKFKMRVIYAGKLNDIA